jgi:hypothetical protein
MPRLLRYLPVVLLLGLLSGCHRGNKDSTQSTMHLFDSTPRQMERGPHKLPDVQQDEPKGADLPPP